MSSRLLSAFDRLRGARPRAAIVPPEPPVPIPVPVPPDIEAAVSAFLDEFKTHPAFKCTHPRHLEQPNGE